MFGMSSSSTEEPSDRGAKITVEDLIEMRKFWIQLGSNCRWENSAHDCCLQGMETKTS